jgi:uncharacterized membrane protein
VVGYTSQVFVEDTQPFLWRKGTLADLPLALPGELAIPSRINNAGDVVGVSFTGTGDVLHAVLLRRGRLISLGLGAATSINNRGDVVGGGPDGAFLSQKGTRIELNSVLPADSGWRLSTATDTNERGQIVGFGEHNGAFFRAFLLSPSREEDDD